MKDISALSSSSIAYSVLRQRLMESVYKPGTPLREIDLAKELGVSRTPVREALRRLSSEGLVEVVPNKGARVAPWNNIDIFTTFGLRQRLEGYAAFQAAELIGDGEIEKLGSLCDEMDEVTIVQSPKRFQELTLLNNSFHRIILEAANDSRLIELMAAVVQVALVRHTFERYTPIQLLRSLAHHRELVAAFRYRDPDWAEAVMSSHIFHARAVLIPKRQILQSPIFQEGSITEDK